MAKKIVLSCIALLGVAAFVLPAAASALNDPQLTSEGKLVPVGTSIVSTALGIVFTDTSGTSLLQCSTAK